LNINESENTKPQEVRDILTEAVVNFKHIYNPDESKKGSEFVQNSVESVFKKIVESPEDAGNLLKAEIESAQNWLTI